MMAATFVPIESVTLASSAASVTFSSIPQTFTDLVVRASIRSNMADIIDYITPIFNGDETTNAWYSNTTLYANNGLAYATRNSNATAQGATQIIINGANSTANTFTNFEWYVVNYVSTTSKASAISSVQEDNSASTGYIDAQAMLYRNTSAITSLTFKPYSGSLVSGCTFHLYGIKNS